MTTKNTMYETRCLSSLTKVFADEELKDAPYQKGSTLLNETYTFQIAYRTKGWLTKGIQVDVTSDLADRIQLRTVGLAPSEFPIYPDHDDDVLRTTPGLYPDPLYPVTDEGIIAFPNQWRSLWVTVDVGADVPSGEHDIDIIFKTSDDETLATETFILDVLPVKLPEQTLIHTQWFHTDCIADQYDVPVFSKKHWTLIQKYAKTAADHGINMILTPLFTPPLDTEVGGERPTVQLVDVEKNGDDYTFTFEKLKQWIETVTESGIKYLEFSHLFTQWGAHHAPKIVATENGIERKIFGWETDATGDTYKSFLDQFLPELVTFIKQQGIENRVYFHVSDEPNIDHLESYKNASDIIHGHLSDFPIMDALSDYDFYKEGLVRNPIPSNNHIEPFLENNVPDLWTYYCCGQYKEVSNRFFIFPSARNRITGMQLYKYNIKGFLQWGYNFWFTQFSKKSLNPFENTDAGYGFPSGDAFIVYPGENGPIESIRMEVFYEALQDQRALQLLGDLIGKEAVIKFLETDLDQPLTFTNYPKDQNWLLKKRDDINYKIVEASLVK